MQLLIKVPRVARKWGVDGYFATVSVIPTVEYEDYPHIANVAVPVLDLAFGYAVSVPAIPCRIEVMLPDGARLESAVRDIDSNEQFVTVTMTQRRRQRRPGVGGYHAIQPFSRVEPRSLEGPRTLSDFGGPPSVGIEFAYDFGHLLPTVPQIDPDKLVSLPQLGLPSGLEIRYNGPARPTAARSFSSPQDIVSFLGLGNDDRARVPSEHIFVASRIRSIGPKTIAKVEIPRCFVDPVRFPKSLRRYGFVTEDGVSYVVPLPTEEGPESSPEIDIRITVRNSKLSKRARKLIVEARPKDELLDSMLTLLQRGEIASAKSILNRATEMLYQKFSNPYLAALGAHVLLGSDGANENVAWHGWVQNLAQSFPHIPDGRIVLAALMLRRARGLALDLEDQPDSEVVLKSKKACLEAVSCGLPQYSASVRLLTRVISVIAGFEQNIEGYPDAEKESTRGLLELAQWMSSQVDPTQGLTVLRHMEHEREYA